VLVAVWSFGSLAGGLVYGARPRRSDLATVHLRIALVLPLLFLPILVAPSVALMALLVLPAGALIAPLIATRNELATVAAPPGARTEALTWPLTALLSGIALGAATAGALVDAASVGGAGGRRRRRGPGRRARRRRAAHDARARSRDGLSGPQATLGRQNAGVSSTSTVKTSSRPVSMSALRNQRAPSGTAA
jgi:hypothetical protein